MKNEVYFTADISSKGLINLYDKMNINLPGKVAVKISSGEMGGHHYLDPKLIMPLVRAINGTLVECNTAYEGSRHNTEEHIKTIRRHGYKGMEILDKDYEIRLPVRKNPHLDFDIVGGDIEKYDSMLVLSHFKGHAMAGFGGALKNIGIGCASSAGKVYIHTAGERYSGTVDFDTKTNQDNFLESIAVAAGAIIDYFGKNIVFINVMNNISIDCDCDSHPEKPRIQDIGICGSTDPVCLDSACIDLIKVIKKDQYNDPRPLLDRIKKQHGEHILDYAEKLGLGKRKINNYIAI